jgi:hypothetical protein
MDYDSSHQHVPASQEVVVEDVKRATESLISKGLLDDDARITESGRRVVESHHVRLLEDVSTLVLLWTNCDPENLRRAVADEYGWEADLMTWMVSRGHSSLLHDVLFHWVTVSGDFDVDGWEERFVLWLRGRWREHGVLSAIPLEATDA